MTFENILPVINNDVLIPNSWEVLIDGAVYWPINAGKSYSVTEPSAGVLRFEVDAGDVWSADPSTKNRSEISGATSFAAGTQVNLSYSMTLEPGAPNTASFLMLGQFHQVDYVGEQAAMPPYSIEMFGEKMAVEIASYNSAGKEVDTVLWEDSQNIVRGHNYTFNVTAVFDDNSNGRLIVVRDGQTIVNYSGPLGYTGAWSSVYWKEGVYRGASTTTIAADYSNLQLTTGSPSTTAALAVSAPTLGLSFTEKLGYDSGVSSSDFITNTGWVVLTGTTSAGATVNILDGTTLIQTQTADNYGNWSFTTNLGLGSHTLSATATLGDTSTSYTNSQAIVVMPQGSVLPVIFGISPDTGFVSNDGITNVNRLILSGTAGAGTTVDVYLDGRLVGATHTDAAGSWSFDGTGAKLSQGQHSVTVQANDGANISGMSAVYKVTVDTTAPTLSLSNLWTASSNGVTVAGTGENTAHVTISEGGVVKGATTVGGSASWGVTLAAQTGVHTYSVSEQDVAGNTTTFSNHVIAGDASSNTLSALAAGDWLWGGGGSDTYVLTPTTTNGTVIGAFLWNDHIEFSGFNAATTTLTEVDANHWRVSDGVHTDTFATGNATTIPHSDWFTH